MLNSLSLLIIAALALTSGARAQEDDISVVGVGALTRPVAPSGEVTPDISVVGWQSGTAIAETPDVSVLGGWTATATVAAATQTECYRVVETGGVMSSTPAQVTVTDDTNPPGYECFLVYATGGGTIHLPLAAATPTVASPQGLDGYKIVTIGVPVIVSVVGLVVIIGAAIFLMRLRARRAAAVVANERTWVDRPGGWVRDGAAGKMESGAARY